MTANVKRKLFHILNERARNKELAKQLHEQDADYAWATDPRKDIVHWQMTRNFPLIDDE